MSLASDVYRVEHVTRLAACGVIRTRFQGRSEMERLAARSLVALVRLEILLGLATEEDLAVAELQERHDVLLRVAHSASLSAGPIARARARYAAIRHLAGAEPFPYGEPQPISCHAWREAQARTCKGCVAGCRGCQDAARLLQLGRLPTPAEAVAAHLCVSPTERFAWSKAAVERPFAERLRAYKTKRAAERKEAAKKRVEPGVRKAYAACDYRTCSAGHTLHVDVAELPSVSTSKNVDWTKYKETDGAYGYPEHVSVHTIRVAADWPRRVAAHGAQVADQRLVLDFTKKTGKATWVEQGKGIGLNVVTGWIVKVGAVWHCATSERARDRLRVASVVEEVRTGAEEPAS